MPQTILGVIPGVSMKVFFVDSSLYGHVHAMAQAVAEWVREAGLGAELYRVPETLPDGVIEKTGAAAFQKEFESVPVIDRRRFGDEDVIIFGTPTRFGNMCGQICRFLDATGGLRTAGALAGARYQGRYVALVTRELGKAKDAILRNKDMR
jgi:NAD(P)H dehydrogenase (quinone)